MALALALALPPAPALGQGLGPMAPHSLVDPLDGQVFETLVPISTNGLGGFDSDGCTHAKGVQARSFAIATSPSTLYSAPLDRFSRPIAPSAREGLTQLLRELAGGETAEELGPTRRFELAAAVADYLGDDSYVVGDLLLEGAWTARDRALGFLPGVQGPLDAWEKLQSTLPLVLAQSEPKPRTLALFDMAWLCHRGGFRAERDALLARLDSFPDAGLGAAGERARMLAAIGEEERLLKQARIRFEEGLALGLGSEVDQRYRRYLVGDLSRRLGNFDRALAELSAVLEDAGTDSALRSLVQDILAALALQGREASVLNLQWLGTRGEIER